MEMEKPIERQSPKYKQIVVEVEYVRKLTFIFRMLHYNDMIEEVEINIDGRPLELTGPQIYLFASKELGSSYRIASSDYQRKDALLIKEILPTLTEFLKKKGQLTEKTLQSVIWDALKSLESAEQNKRLIHRNSIPEVNTGKIRNLIEIAYELIYDKVKELTDSKDSTTANEQAFYSADYGKITHREVLKICKSTFRGESGRIDISDGNGRIQTKSLNFDKEIIKKVGKTFEAVTKIEILGNRDGNAQEEKLDATEQRNFGKCEEIRDNEESNGVDRQKQNKNETSNIHTDQEKELKKSHDIHRDYRNIMSARNDPDRADNTNDKNGVYTSTPSNSVAQLLEQPQRQIFKKEVNDDTKESLSCPNPSLSETTRLLNNLREVYDEYQCSTCQHKEAIWKNSATKPLFCPKCKSNVLQKKED